jgi:hypothetical protein
MRECGFTAVPARNFFSPDEAILRADKFERCPDRECSCRECKLDEFIDTLFFFVVKTVQKVTSSYFDFSLNICKVESNAVYRGNRVWGFKFFTDPGITSVENSIATGTAAEFSLQKSKYYSVIFIPKRSFLYNTTTIP